MSGEKKRRVAIIGAGRVGTALGVLLARQGYSIGGVVGRTPATAREAVAVIGAGRPGTDPIQGAADAGIVLVTVPDRAIAPVVRSIASGRSFGPTDWIIHTSGALPADVLRVPGTEEAVCLSLHPIQTIADRRDGARQLQGAAYGVEGEPMAVDIGVRLVQCLGGRPLRIKPGAKALYHAAACMASNYLITLLDASLSLYERAGLSRNEDLEAVSPLVTGTLANVRQVGIPQSLTGPIERADVKTVQAHVEALAHVDVVTHEDDGKDAMPEVADGQHVAALYRLLGLMTVRLAERKAQIDHGSVDDATVDRAAAYDELKRILRGVEGNGE